MPNSPDLPSRSRRNAMVFANRPASVAPTEVRPPWKVLISDDDEAVHQVSRVILKDFCFDGRGLQFMSARSGGETRKLIRDNPDTAVLLLDVVMETEQAGLDVVHHIRQELKNSLVRIILRTGQPGQAPEQEVVERYDINDYREKTELTARKLTTSLMSALRSYRDLRNLESSRHGLERVIGACHRLFEHQSARRFIASMLQQLSSLTEGSDSALYFNDRDSAPRSADTRPRPEDFQVVAGTGSFANAIGLTLDQVLTADQVQRVLAPENERRVSVDSQAFIGWFHTFTGPRNLVFLPARTRFEDIDIRVLRLFAATLGIAFENLHLNRELSDTQTEIIQTLSDIVESRSAETSRHTYRVGRCAEHLGKLIGLSDDQVEMLRQVAPMHDLGKVGIPDAILNKPGALTAEEYQWVKAHTTIGYNILKGSHRLIMRTAGLVCLQHHERWDGSGYPQGLRGYEIDILARVVGIVDVFDAVSHNRPYKTAWPPEQVYAYINDQRNRQFDPDLVDVMLQHFEQFLTLRDET